MTENPGGSCEPCKKKKCKCDRQLPLCGQCQGTNLVCKYAEGNKRGIPTGYLGTLEQRLNETEAALYSALCEIRSLRSQDLMTQQDSFSASVSPQLVPRELNMSKTSRMTEWKEYPLHTREGIEKWRDFFSRNEIPTQEEQPVLEMAQTYPDPTTEQQPRDDPSSNQNFERSTFNTSNDFTHTQSPTNAQALSNLTNYAPSTDRTENFSLQSPLSNSGVFNPNFQDRDSSILQDNTGTAHTATGDIAAGGAWSHTQVGEARLEETPRDGTGLNRSQRLSAVFRNTYY